MVKKNLVELRVLALWDTYITYNVQAKEVYYIFHESNNNNHGTAEEIRKLDFQKQRK